jgi:hypothetical protein
MLNDTETLIRLTGRFWPKVDRTGACWLWTAHIGKDGYGTFSIDGHHHRAHRVAWVLLHGPIPDGLQIDHLCRVRHCVNPDHLEPVTQRENILRGEGLSAQAIRRTHCRQGHEYAGANLINRRGGGRDCRACDNARCRRAYLVRKARKAVTR